MTSRGRAILLLAALGLGGCSRRAAWPPSPAAVHLGEDACEACRMIISDEHFGAQLHVRGGEVSNYDDVGCLLMASAGRTLDPRGVFVRDYASGGWLRGDAAFVVTSPTLGSPMGYGQAAFASPQAAAGEAARHSGARVAALAELLGRPPPAPVRAAVGLRDPEPGRE